MRVIRVLPGSPLVGIIEPSDVLLAIDGMPIAEDGTVALRPGERTSFALPLQSHQLNDTATITWLRDGEERSADVTLTGSMGSFGKVPMETYDTPPSYFIYGGLVFQPLSKSYLQVWGKNWGQSAPKPLVVILTDFNPRTVEGEEVVVMSRVLAGDVNEGYHSERFFVVNKVDGKPVLNMRGLLEAVEAPSDAPFIVFEDRQGYIIALRRADVASSTSKILGRYKVPADRSPDLVDSVQ